MKDTLKAKTFACLLLCLLKIIRLVDDISLLLAVGCYCYPLSCLGLPACCPFVHLDKHNNMPVTCSFTPFPMLTTERLVLRRATMKDDKEIFFQRSDKGMNEYVGNPLAQTIDDARAWIEKIDTIIDTNEGISWGVTLKGDDKLKMT